MSTAQVAAVLNRAADLGVDEIAFADTIGVGVPAQVNALASLVAVDSRIPRLRFHFHNTRNTGYANAWAAARLDTIPEKPLALDASVGGIGGCPFAPAGPIYTAADMIADPQYLARDMIQVMPEGIVGETRQVAFPGVVPLLGEKSLSAPQPGPDLGEHAHEVISELLGRPCPCRCCLDGMAALTGDPAAGASH